MNLLNKLGEKWDEMDLFYRISFFQEAQLENHPMAMDLVNREWEQLPDDVKTGIKKAAPDFLMFLHWKDVDYDARVEMINKTGENREDAVYLAMKNWNELPSGIQKQVVQANVDLL